MSEAISPGPSDPGESDPPSSGPNQKRQREAATSLARPAPGPTFDASRPHVVLVAAPVKEHHEQALSSDSEAPGETREEDGALSSEQALLAKLEDRIAELEMRLRERDEAEQLHNAELQALERDLVIKEAYIDRLEFEQQLLKTEIGQVRARAAELFSDLERAEARLVELGALAADIQNQASYRAAVRAVGLVKRARRLLSSLTSSSPTKSVR